MPKQTIPPLLLADRGALRSRSFSEMIDMISNGVPSGWRAHDGSCSDDSQFKFNTLSVKETTLLAFSMTGQNKYRASSAPVPLLSISFQGDFVYKQGNRTLGESGGRVATLVAADDLFDGESPPGSIGIGLAFSPDPDRLKQTMRTMVGADTDAASCHARLDQSRELPLQYADVDLFASFKQLVRMIESVEDQPVTMSYLALDDVLYRHAALILRPDLFLTDSVPASGSFRRLDDVCDYMRMHLDKPITLTELESVSGLSARSLQYAFQKRFGCTPLQWLSNERLDLARRKLLNPDRAMTVTRVALDTGFSNPGHFARKYYERFGELPSLTLGSNSLPC